MSLNSVVQCNNQDEDNRPHLGYFTQPLSYLPTPPLGQDMTQGQFLSGV